MNTITDLEIKDWEMTNERIKHFDNIIMHIRIQGIPIATAIVAIAIGSAQYTKTTKIFFTNGLFLTLIFAVFYIIPIALLDLTYFWLLLKAVDHAKSLETKSGNQLYITHTLTSKTLTYMHSLAFMFMYFILAIATVILAITIAS